MSKKRVKKNVKQTLDAINPWEQAISDAELLIKMLKSKIRGLKGAIVGFKDMRDSGEPWPGTQSKQTQAVVNDPVKRDAREAGVG